MGAFDIKTLFGGFGGFTPPHALAKFFLFIFKSIENLYKIYRTDLLSRKFALGGFMRKGIIQNDTMLIRLSTEMKKAFFDGCKARGLVPSEEARRLIVAEVLKQWQVKAELPQNTSVDALERCDSTLDMFQGGSPGKPPNKAKNKKKR